MYLTSHVPLYLIFHRTLYLVFNAMFSVALYVMMYCILLSFMIHGSYFMGHLVSQIPFPSCPSPTFPSLIFHKARNTQKTLPVDASVVFAYQNYARKEVHLCICTTPYAL